MKTAPAFTARSVLSNFGPWIVYGILSGAGHARAAYACGLIVSLCLIVPSLRARRGKIVDGVTLLFFSAGAVSTLALHSSLFPDNGPALIWGALALVAWGSLLAGEPFTAQYARDAVPEEYWDSPGFRRVNVVITAAWGAVFVVNTALSVSLGHTGTWLQALPYVGTAFGIMFTNRYPQWARRHRTAVNRPDS